MSGAGVNKLATKLDLKAPVIEKLPNLFPAQRPTKKGAKGEGSSFSLQQTDIISDKLCDDVIEYLAPTLEQYKGCTVIDIHPGACQWSAKLHDFLRPKRHLLMEPDERYVEPFIQPLLGKPDSTFRHTTLSGAHPRAYWENYRKLLNDEDLVPHRPRRAPDDPKLRQLDTSFLVTGNLARRYDVHVPLGAVTFAPLILQHMTWAALSNDIFHYSGLVRMLWWIPETSKAYVIPPTTHGRTAFNIGLNMGADISEVVGVNRGYEGFKRSSIYHPSLPDKYLSAATAQNVQSRMQASGMRVPDGRKTRSNDELPTNVAETLKSPLEVFPETIVDFAKDVERLEERSRNIFYKALTDKSPQVRNKVKKSLVTSIEYRQHWQSDTGSPRIPKRVALLLDLLLRLVNLETRCRVLEEQREDVQILKERLFAIDDQYHSYEWPLAQARQLEHMFEDYVAFLLEPQTLAIDRRPYNPLQASAEDFWPHEALTLLDVTPVGRDLTVPGIVGRKEAASTGQELLKSLTLNMGHSVEWALDHIAPNAAKDLIPMVPAITDPRRGGRLRPRNVKISMLTEEMWEGLIKAWYEWPFRPPSWQMAPKAFRMEGDDQMWRGMSGIEDDGLSQSVSEM